MSRRLRRPARLRQGAVSGTWANNFEGQPNHASLPERGRSGRGIRCGDAGPHLGEAANGAAAVVGAWLPGVTVCV
jgi:hypothetical protein